MKVQSSLSHYLIEAEPLGVTPLNTPVLLSLGKAMPQWSMADMSVCNEHRHPPPIKERCPGLPSVNRPA